MKTPFFKTWILVLATLMLAMQAFARDRSGLDVIPVRELPVEAQRTLVLVKQGGPFPYPKDGVVFGNYEKLLPKQRRGYYHEYTVKTPGARNRGARRIVAGGDPATSGEYYYTEDHYATFRRIIE
jgi:ribonuclease T1